MRLSIIPARHAPVPASPGCDARVKGPGTPKALGAVAREQDGGFPQTPLASPLLAPGAHTASQVALEAGAITVGLGEGAGEGFGGVWLQVEFLQGGETESIAIPVRPLWSPRSGFGCSPANPRAVALLRGAGENVGLSLSQPLLPGELLPAHRSPSGGFWLCPPLPRLLLPWETAR